MDKLAWLLLALAACSAANHPPAPQPPPQPQPQPVLCVPGETRCNGNVSEMCNAEGFWDVILNCSDLGEFKCEVTSEGALCQ